MDEVIAVSESDVSPEPRLAPKGHPLVAWVVIILITGFLVVYQSLRSEKRTADTEDRAGLLTMQLQARSIVGVAHLFSAPSGQTQVQSLNTGPIARRLRAIVLEGELAGPQQAAELLNDLDQKITSKQLQLSDKDKNLKQVLTRLYADYAKEKYDAPSLEPSDRGYLRKELGWFGELALAPAEGPNTEARTNVMDTADRSALILLGAFGLGILAAVAGLFSMIFMLVLFYAGHLWRGFKSGIAHGGLYAETFAIWMALFLALEFVVGVISSVKYRFLLLGLAMLLSLTALVWPVWRGVPWKRVREDVGLANGHLPILEPFFGLAGYVMTLPMAIVGALVMTGLMALRNALMPTSPADNFAPLQEPSHPVMEPLVTGNWWFCVQVVVVASIIAPIVEETMFRGVLYRHLREASARLGVTMSVIASGLLVSFVFAAIHPQGLLAVPPLMGLAFGFALLREWRGTLIPSMVAHGINNGLVTMLVVLLASG